MKAMLGAVAVIVLATGANAVGSPSPDSAFTGAARFMERDGEALFRNVCAGCHMPDAKGAVGAARYPALAMNANLRLAAYPIAMVVNGRKAMPSFARTLDDEQIATVVNYIRTNFGNAYADRVTAADVRAARS